MKLDLFIIVFHTATELLIVVSNVENDVIDFVFDTDYGVTELWVI